MNETLKPDEPKTAVEYDFHAELKQDFQKEKLLLYKELGVIFFLIVFILVREWMLG